MLAWHANRKCMYVFLYIIIFRNVISFEANAKAKKIAIVRSHRSDLYIYFEKNQGMF